MYVDVLLIIFYQYSYYQYFYCMLAKLLPLLLRFLRVLGWGGGGERVIY